MNAKTCVKNNYAKRIEELAKTKVKHTELKIKKNGFFDIDDHGYIPWDEPISFKRKSNHPSGGSYGMKCIGENFHSWLEVHPVYIHPMSAIAGAWVGTIPEVGGWRPEDEPKHLYPTYRKYNVVYTGIGAMNHIGPDMRIGFELGWGGLLKKVRHFRNLNRFADSSFYDGEENLILGIQEWIRHHVEKAREMAMVESNEEIRNNLIQIADMNEWLVEGPPRNLREVCQFIGWFQVVDRMWALGGALGQLDELLRPFYEEDKAAGIDDEEVIWIIASLFFNDTHYSQIGGPAPNGHDVTSPISFLILEAAHRLKIPANLAVRVHEGLDPGLLRRAVKYIIEDGTGPSFSCSKGLDDGYMKNGVPRSIARMRAKVGCNWTALPGIEYCLQDIMRLCLVSPFLHAFYELVDDPEKPKTMDALWDLYVHHLENSVDNVKLGFDWHLEHHARNSPEIVLNLFCHGPIERGLDVSEGGVDVYNLTCDGVGLATVADSIAAIEQRVVNEKQISLENLKKALDENFAGAEDIRLMMKSIPRFGSGGSRADWWAKRVSKLFTRLVKDKPTPNGINVIPGLFSHGIVHTLGKNLGATPNGRFAHDPISHNAEPDPGFAADWSAAPTAKSNAVAAVQPGWGNSAPLQIDIDRGLINDHGGIEAIEALIKGHNLLGGTLVNLNVISKEQILGAHKDPERYPDLLVRVTGYSGYFRSLSPQYRQQVVDRFLGLD